jgi:hypothetical protein
MFGVASTGVPDAFGIAMLGTGRLLFGGSRPYGASENDRQRKSQNGGKCHGARYSSDRCPYPRTPNP